jgi:hypothetical protein
MSNGRIIQLESIHALHPKLGLRDYLQATVVRLSVHPVKLDEGIRTRTVQVDHRRMEADWDVRWHETSDDYSPAQLTLFSNGVNEGDITERAAVGMMATLVSALEGMEIRGVSQIGTGGDYVLQLPGATENVLVECSGVLQDPSGSETRRRLKDNGEQVLQRSKSGFASVTTFAYGAERIVRSSLHFFEKSDPSMIKPTAKRKPRR